MSWAERSLHSPAPRTDDIFDVVDVSEILHFRQAMLWPDKPLSHVMLPDDDTALHICGRLDRRVIAAGSFFVGGDAAQLRKMAVDPVFRGQQLGKNLVMYGACEVAKQGVKVLWCDARVESAGFYERLGFRVEDSEYEKSGALYRKASMQLA